MKQMTKCPNAICPYCGDEAAEHDWTTDCWYYHLSNDSMFEEAKMRAAKEDEERAMRVAK
jgi:hypothetical protein